MSDYEKAHPLEIPAALSENPGQLSGLKAMGMMDDDKGAAGRGKGRKGRAGIDHDDVSAGHGRVVGGGVSAGQGRVVCDEWWPGGWWPLGVVCCLQYFC